MLRDWRVLKAKIDNTPGVVATAPYIQGPVIVEFQNRRLAPLIRGIDPKLEEKVIPLQKFIKYGKLDLESESTVLGIELARKLGVRVGDKVTIYSPGNVGQMLDTIKKLENAKGEEEKKAIDELRDVILPKELTVAGIFETGHYLHDSEFLLVPVYVGQELYGLGDALHGITVKTDNPYDAEHVKQAIHQFLEPPEYAQTWIDMNHQYFEAVRLERTVMFFHRDRCGIRNHEHTHHSDRAKTARDRNHESAWGKHRANHLGFSWPGNNCRSFWNAYRPRAGDDADSLPERIQPLACIDVAHRDFPARSLSIFVDPGGSDSERRCNYLHQRIFHLFLCRADPRLLCRAPRSGQSLALRVTFSHGSVSRPLPNRPQGGGYKAPRKSPMRETHNCIPPAIRFAAAQQRLVRQSYARGRNRRSISRRLPRRNSSRRR